VEWYGNASGVGTADAFNALRTPRRRGRSFDERDLSANTTAVLVKETLAQRCWPGENAVAKTIRSRDAKDPGLYEVVGVVAGVRHWPWDPQPPVWPMFYRPPQVNLVGGTYPAYLRLVRTRAKPNEGIKPLWAELKAAAPAWRKPNVVVVKDAFYDSTRGHRT